MRRAGLGFTLIELLVVLVILALFTGMVVISLGDNSVREMRAEAERFQSLVIAAADEAVFSSAQLGFVLDTDGYQVLQLDSLTGRWRPTGNQAFTEHRVPGSMTLDWNIEGFWRVKDSYETALQVDEDLFSNNAGQVDAFGEGQPLDPADEQLLDTVTPHILVLSSGELTAFTVRFTPARDLDSGIAVEVTSDGFSMPITQTLEQQ